MDQDGSYDAAEDVRSTPETLASRLQATHIAKPSRQPVSIPPSRRPTITLLSLESTSFQKEYYKCIEALVERANVEEITSWQRANTFFQQQGYKKSTVVITDQGLAKAKYQSTLIHASGFVRSGGRLIFGGTFAALSSRSEINAVFKMLLLR